MLAPLRYQPDTIVYKTIGSTGYLFLANEGDGKANWEMRVKDLDASQVGEVLEAGAPQVL